MNNHPYHLVDKSPWPITSSMGMLTMMSGSIMWLHKLSTMLMNLGMMIILMTMFQWWRDITRESTFQEMHTKKVMLSMKMGMILFIVSEIMFFTSFFWSFFHSSLSPNMEIGMNWPPNGVKPFNSMNIPMLNTIILLTSGMSMTWAHNAMVKKNFTMLNQSLILTIFLGVYFSIMQMYEYMEASFSISDSIYGSTFFMSTGFHGIHVMIGTTLITIMLQNTFFKLSPRSIWSSSLMLTLRWCSMTIYMYMSVYWWGNKFI